MQICDRKEMKNRFISSVTQVKKKIICNSMRTYDRSNTRQHLSSTNGLLDMFNFTLRVCTHLFECHFADDDAYNDIIYDLSSMWKLISTYK